MKKLLLIGLLLAALMIGGCSREDIVNGVWSRLVDALVPIAITLAGCVVSYASVSIRGIIAQYVKDAETLRAIDEAIAKYERMTIDQLIPEKAEELRKYLKEKNVYDMLNSDLPAKLREAINFKKKQLVTEEAAKTTGLPEDEIGKIIERRVAVTTPIKSFFRTR